MTSLGRQLGEWAQWSRQADSGEDGWETMFPGWRELAKECQRAMLSPNALDQVDHIAECWRISEEAEEMAEFARKHVSALATMLVELCRACHPDVRWQAIDVIGDTTIGFEATFRAAFIDPDPYVRQRAFLAFARHRLVDHEMLKRVLSDPGPYVRRVAWELAHRTGRAEEVAFVRQAMETDKSEVVRLAVTRPMDWLTAAPSGPQGE